MSRNIDKMHPLLLKRYIAYTARMEEMGLPFIITCVDRSLTVQMALYAQGRLPVKDVNKYRQAAGMDEISERRNIIVTWTLLSDHIIKLGKKYVTAFDIALLKYNRPHWDIKISVNDNEIPDYKEAGFIAKECGLESGVFWESPDSCHIYIELPKASGIPNETPA